MKQKTKINKVQFQKFCPLDMDTPILEILFGNEIIMDVARDDSTGDFEVVIYKNICKKPIPLKLLAEIIDKSRSFATEVSDSL